MNFPTSNINSSQKIKDDKKKRLAILLGFPAFVIIIIIFIISITLSFKNKRTLTNETSQSSPPSISNEYSPLNIHYQKPELLYAEIKNQIIKLFKSK